jgi:Mrp family chromosome partitioning ATPase
LELLPNAAEDRRDEDETNVRAILTVDIHDCIIVEIAPIMSVVDIKTIERFIDRFVFVIEWGETKRRLVQEALSEVHIIRERIIGSSSTR